MSSSTELLLRLRHFVQSEAQVQWEEIRQQWSRPLPERVLKGWAVNDLSVEKIGGNTVADDEREMLIQDNTRKIYMAATRAGQRLVFTYVGELPAIMKNLLFTA